MTAPMGGKGESQAPRFEIIRARDDLLLPTGADSASGIGAPQRKHTGLCRKSFPRLAQARIAIVIPPHHQTSPPPLLASGGSQSPKGMGISRLFLGGFIKSPPQVECCIQRTTRHAGAPLNDCEITLSRAARRLSSDFFEQRRFVCLAAKRCLATSKIGKQNPPSLSVSGGSQSPKDGNFRVFPPPAIIAAGGRVSYSTDHPTRGCSFSD